MKTIALSIFRDRISSRLDSADEVLLLTLKNQEVKSRESVRIMPGNPLDKIQQIIQLNPDVLICGGLTQLCDYKLKYSKINVIPWVKGNTDEVLNSFLKGNLSEPVKINNKL
ncbi:NifB/NifX family molybdenum-iron cluster-binding protein [Bacteroidota bacterium]|jgi:predicted Fe-Mo cluster-binding NifX family protein